MTPRHSRHSASPNHVIRVSEAGIPAAQKWGNWSSKPDHKNGTTRAQLVKNRREQSPPALQQRGANRHGDPRSRGVSLNRTMCSQTFLQMSMHMNDFDAQAIAAQLKAQSAAKRKPRSYNQRRSRLDDYKFELLELDSAGCNGTQLQTWLAEKKQLRVERSTINRWLHRNRVQDNSDG